MDKREFITIIKDHQNLIFKICYSYCSEYEDRKDLEQEILIQIWKSLKKFDNGVKLSTWIYRVALNTAISFYRKESKSKKHEVLDDSIIIFDEEQGKASIDDNISSLYHFINQLEKLDKALILLYLDEKKQKEIALILGITESNVATKISRIKKKLKENFQTN